MPGPYNAGTTIRIKATLADADSGSFIDPDTVAFTVHGPTTSSPATFTHDSLGHWTVEFVPTAAGSWVIEMATTNPIAVFQRTIQVIPVPFA